MFVVDSCDVGDDNDNDDSSLPARRTVNSSTKKSNREDEQEEEEAAAGRHQPNGRLSECRLALETILEHPSTASIPLLVLANKQDREDCVETVRIKEGLIKRVFETEAGSKALRDTRVLPCSALRGDGVAEAVDWVRTRVRWNKEGGRAPVMR